MKNPDPEVILIVLVSEPRIRKQQVVEDDNTWQDGIVSIPSCQFEMILL